MGGKAPDPPDFSGQVAALNNAAALSAAAADKSYDLGIKQLDFQRNAFNEAAEMGRRYFNDYHDSIAENRALLHSVFPSIQKEMDLQNITAEKAQDYLDTQTAAARTAADRGSFLFDRYTGKILPLQDKLIDKAQSYFSPARAAEDAARAKADVATQFDQARANTEAQLAGYGISPDEGRSRSFEGIAANLRAAAQAAAGTSSRLNTERTGIGLLSDVYNTGSGFPSQALGYATATSGLGGSGFGAANTSGVAGVNAGLGGVSAGTAVAPAQQYASLALNPFVNALSPFGSSASSIYGTGAQQAQTGVSALSGAGQLQQYGFQDALSSFNANSQATSSLFGGLGKLIGGGISLATGGGFFGGG